MAPWEMVGIQYAKKKIPSGVAFLGLVSPYCQTSPYLGGRCRWIRLLLGNHGGAARRRHCSAVCSYCRSVAFVMQWRFQPEAFEYFAIHFKFDAKPSGRVCRYALHPLDLWQD